MRPAHFKPCFATVALLAAFLSAQHLRAGKFTREGRISAFEGRDCGSCGRVTQIVADDPRNVDAHLLLGTVLALQGTVANPSNKWP